MSQQDERITIVDVEVDATTLLITLKDGRCLYEDTARYPRLAGATEAQRNHYRITPDGTGIHWPDVDEDISARVILGLPS